jgi:hypothetical protein
MTHAFMYPRVTQIATRAHSVPASSLRLHPGRRDARSGPAASSGAMPVASGMQAPGRRDRPVLWSQSDL